MNERKKLKKELGRKYIFKKFMTAGQVRKLFALKNQRLEKIFAALTVGNVRINALVFVSHGKTGTVCDILVRDIPTRTKKLKSTDCLTQNVILKFLRERN